MSSFLSYLNAYWALPETQISLSIFEHLLVALFLGLFIGYERTYHGRAAGMRTYALVCMASAALTVISGYPNVWFGGHPFGAQLVDPTRVMQGIVTGIGFLGAGIIMKDGRSISGLTTAASIWASSAIGIMVGLGFYMPAVVFTLISVFFMMWGLRVESWLPSHPAVSIVLRFRKGYIPTDAVISTTLALHGYAIARGTIAISNHDGQYEWHFIAIAFGRTKGAPLITLSQVIPSIDGIECFQVSHARN